MLRIWKINGIQHQKTQLNKKIKKFVLPFEKIPRSGFNIYRQCQRKTQRQFQCVIQVWTDINKKLHDDLAKIYDLPQNLMHKFNPISYRCNWKLYRFFTFPRCKVRRNFIFQLGRLQGAFSTKDYVNCNFYGHMNDAIYADDNSNDFAPKHWGRYT